MIMVADSIPVYLSTVMITVSSQLTTYAYIIISNVNNMAGETHLVTKPNFESIVWTYFGLDADW